MSSVSSKKAGSDATTDEQQAKATHSKQTLPTTDPVDVARRWLQDLSAACATREASSISELFQADGYLRETLVFSWDRRTQRGRDLITKHIARALDPDGILGDGTLSAFIVEEDQHVSPVILMADQPGAVELTFRFETPLALCRGTARLFPSTESDGWKAGSAYVFAVDWKGHEEAGPDLGVWDGHSKPYERVMEERRCEVESDPYVLIVGAGQTGLNVGARLQRLGLRTLIVEKDARVGDEWRRRYRTLTLHTPRQQHMLLYHPYPTTWPIYTPKDKLAHWMEQYSESQELVIWKSSSISSQPRPYYDSATARWTVVVNRAGQDVTLHPAHIVLATGVLGRPAIPQLPARDVFLGKVIHASEFHSADDFRGQRVLVVGAANTAADICQDLAHSGVKTVTMLQRSSSCVVFPTALREHFAVQFPPGVPSEVCDLRLESVPLHLRARLIRSDRQQANEQGRDPDIGNHEDQAMKDGLLARGFKLNVGPNGLGLPFLIVERFGGHWVDVGCASLIISGQVSLKNGAEVAGYTQNGVVLTDGSEITADVVIYATGYENSRELYRELFGPEVIDATSKIWGLDEEGELQGVYRPTGHPGLWYTGGDFHASRWFSRDLGLLIKARQLGFTK